MNARHCTTHRAGVLTVTIDRECFRALAYDRRSGAWYRVHLDTEQVFEWNPRLARKWKLSTLHALDLLAARV